MQKHTNDLHLFEVIRITKALANQSRLNMVIYLQSSKLAMASSFTRVLGISQSQVSRGLKTLVECSLFKKEKIGNTWIYTIAEDKLALVQQLLRDR